MNFDKIFKLVKTLVEKYVVLDDHFITLLAADTVYSNFQDKFSTTHYIFLLGDNGSGKNAILTTYASLGYRVFAVIGASGANVFTALGDIEAGQITMAEDEASNVDNDPDKMNILKAGYQIEGSRIPKTDLSNGRKQNLYHTYCFKMYASESSLDNLKAKGFLDRSFEIPCLVGKPTHNIKKVYENTKTSNYLRTELEKTRKLLFACRMIYYDTVIKNIGLTVFNREAELIEPVIRVFQNSPETLKLLLPTLTKCVKAKRDKKSSSLEAVLFKAVSNLTAICNKIDDKDNENLSEAKTYFETYRNTILCKDDTNTKIELLKKGVEGWTIDYRPIYWETKRLTGASNAFDKEDKEGESGFHCNLGRISHRQIIKTLKEKFKAEPSSIGRGSDKRDALYINKENLDRKKTDYDLLLKDISIETYIDNIPPGPDSFDSILPEDGAGSMGSKGSEVGESDQDMGSGGLWGLSGPNYDMLMMIKETQVYAQIASDIKHETQSESTSEHPPIQTPQAPRPPEPELPQEGQNKPQSSGEFLKESQLSDSKLDQFGIEDPILRDSKSVPTQEAKSTDIDLPPKESQPDPKTEEELKPLDLPMPEELEDHLGVVTEKELPIQEEARSKRMVPWNPIISVEDFFSNDISLLDRHSIEQSPCYPIIGSRTDQQEGNVVNNDGNVVDKMGYPNTVYYCKLHPDLGSVFLDEIEFHCKQKEQDIHRSEILSRAAKYGEQQQVGESA